MAEVCRLSIVVGRKSPVPLLYMLWAMRLIAFDAIRIELDELDKTENEVI